VDTFADAPVYASETSTTQTGTLHQGTSYVSCKVWGRQIGDATSCNHWRLKTDPDTGRLGRDTPAEGPPVDFTPTSGDGVRIIGVPGGTKTFTSIGELEAYYSGGASGAPVKYWVDTSPTAPVYGSPTSTAQTGTLNAGTNYVYCKEWGRQIGNVTTYNHWWLKTDPDTGPANQYVSAYYLTRWGNDEAKDNNGTVIPDC
jgi:hypothetical protein